MKALARLLSLYFVVSFYVGCSKVKFGVDDAGCQSVGQSCVVINGKKHFDNTINVGGGKVDILIVNDNSASMSFEQKALANRFAGFLAQLDAKSVDYRIAMTTTDIHESGDGNDPRSINGNGALQNGNLISFGGIPYLTPSVGDRLSRFNAAIVRNETLNCEQYIANAIQAGGISATGTASYEAGYKANCPSGDERGVYAANLVVKNNPSSFLRPEAHLAIIFLSDEDERSQLYGYSQYALSTNDQPTTLVNNIYATATGKTASVHAIVVKDNNCLAQQNDQTLGSPPVAETRGFVKGSIGNVYLSFTSQGWGKAVDICASSGDYTTQLGEIGSIILDKINSAKLACSNPENLTVNLNSSDASITWTRQNDEIRFSKQLPVGSTVRLVYDCAGTN